MSARRRTTRTVIVAGVLGIVAAACVPVTPPPDPTPPPPFTPTPVFDKSFATGLARPWDLAFAPNANRHLVFTENDSGKISTWVPSRAPQRLDLGTVAGVDGNSEGGLMGLAFHPDFPSTPSLYVCYSTSADNRVARLTVTLDGSGNPASVGAQTDLITGIPHNSFHNGCRVRFQPGSSRPALFVTTGDAGIGLAPQDPSSLAGKVLRLLDDGTAYPGNASGQRWYTKGHRNPQGIAFNPNRGFEPYSVEHGSSVDDEVNQLVNGWNAGWDPYEPGAAPPNFYNDKLVMTNFSLPTPPPIFGAIWSSGRPTIAPSGATFLSDGWGAWNGALVLAVLKNMELRILFLDANGALSSQMQVPGSTGTRLRSAVQGPDGALYIATDLGQIWRVTPQ